MEASGRPQTLTALPQVKNSPYQVSWFERFENPKPFVIKMEFSSSHFLP
jgi:hypothetical protein